jgi:hypothetical protein
MNEQTIRGPVWRVLEIIQSLKPKKVLLGNFENLPIFIILVDGTHCETYKVYSHKSHSPGVAYETGRCVFENRLVWINGPCDASIHDITIFRNKDDPENSLKNAIPEGKRAIKDLGYRGEMDTKTAPPNSKDSKELKMFKNRARARHDNFNAHLKAFKILSETL